MLIHRIFDVGVECLAEALDVPRVGPADRWGNVRRPVHERDGPGGISRMADSRRHAVSRQRMRIDAASAAINQ
jgi:hypothetical protein